MTKDEIKKGLEVCTQHIYCKDCPYRNRHSCMSRTQQDALDLITEQEKEIEKKGQIIENLNGLIDYADKENRKLKADKQELATALRQSEDNYSRAFERLKAQQREIKQLKAGTKQAKLNILAKLWSNISNSKQLIQSYIADGSFTIEDIYMEIDELLAEVQNAEDND